jgi:pyruvate dehydrogenase E2 component (dihydrolipoamide acetyltransferase)
VNHFLIAAVARALLAMPAMNRVAAGEDVLELARIDIGLAVEGQKGLVAPVLRDLGALVLDDIAEAATGLVERARLGKLTQAELSGGATTISNVGMFGATGLIPIINPGQSSILGVGRNRPEFRPDAHSQPQLRQILDLSLSCDHRVIDGALGARFLQQIQAGLEAPMTLLRRAAPGSQS